MTKSPEFYCDGCRKPITHTTGFNTEPVRRPGAIVICTHCLLVSIVQEDLSLRTATPVELKLLARIPVFQQAMQTVRQLQFQQNTRNN